MIPPRPASKYALASYEVDLVRRAVHVRMAPLVEGHPDMSGVIEYETIRNEPEPRKPPVLPARPEPPADGASDEEHLAHAQAMQGWLAERRLVLDATAKYEAALRAGKGWDDWMADPRPDHLKAEEHFARRRGTT